MHDPLISDPLRCDRLQNSKKDNFHVWVEFQSLTIYGRSLYIFIFISFSFPKRHAVITIEGISCNVHLWEGPEQALGLAWLDLVQIKHPHLFTVIMLHTDRCPGQSRMSANPMQDALVTVGVFREEL